MTEIGIDWSFSPLWILGFVSLFAVLLFWHGKSLLQALTSSTAWKLIFLRIGVMLFVLLLLVKPYLITQETDPAQVRVVSLLDLSASMDTTDQSGGKSRLDLVQPHLNPVDDNSWIHAMRKSYGYVDSLGFSEESWPLVTGEFDISYNSPQTALGDALSNLLDQKEDLPISAVVLFSDGKNNLGQSPLEVANLYRELGIPVNVIGVGESRERGNVSIEFQDPPDAVTAKEEFSLEVLVLNEFKDPIDAEVELLLDGNVLANQSVSLLGGENRLLSFDSLLMEVAGTRNLQARISVPDGDSDLSDNADFLVLPVRPPDLFSVLHISNRVGTFYPFLKRGLSAERFQFNSQIKLSEKTYHSLGENIPENGFSHDPDFWMQFDVVMMDLGCLDELNSTLVHSLKDYVQKRGGGLLTYGSLENARSHLGGLLPAVEGIDLQSKQNLSLEVISDPLFEEQQNLNSWKTFLPHSLPSVLVTRVNPAARRSVNLSSNSEKSLLVVQAYGAGKTAYWGSPGDWRRALASPDQKREFTIFWQSVTEWLGSGVVERLKIQNPEEDIFRGSEISLEVDALGGNFEPSLDAMIEANISGPNQYSQLINLYPEGGRAGAYSGKFKPMIAGNYQLDYLLKFPDGEKLRQTSYLSVGDSSAEALDVRYTERDLQMIATLTGGKFSKIGDFDPEWRPALSDRMPTVSQKMSLAKIWPIFVLLFFFAGAEWILRRKEGLK